MSFQDIFKSSFLENVTEFSLLDTCIGLAAALLCLRSYPLHLGELLRYIPLGERRKCGS